MTVEIGTTVRLLVDAIDDSGMVVPIGSRGVVVGYQGDRVIVSFGDDVAVLNVWEVRAEKPVRVRA